MSEQGNIVICEWASGLANNRYFERLQKLSKDELGVIYCKMNCFEWCDIFGDPPEGYEKMTGKKLYHDPAFREAFDAVSGMLTEEEKSMYWWTIELERTKEEWAKWWYDQKNMVLIDFEE